MNGWRNALMVAFLLGTGALSFAGGTASLPATTPGITDPSTPPVTVINPKIQKIRAIDADNRNIWINRPGKVTLVLCTSEDSQDPARKAGAAVYPFQGRPDFQLMVVVDLRDSLATWVPSIALQQMRANLDREAVGLKPYYLKNGNKSNPRGGTVVIADFNGTVCPRLGWANSSDDLRAVIFGTDGSEIKRYEKLEDMFAMQRDVNDAIQAHIDADKARYAAAAKTQGTKLLQPPNPLPPLPVLPFVPPDLEPPPAPPSAKPNPDKSK